MLIGSPHQLSSPIVIDGSAFEFQKKNLGVIFDSSLTSDPHVQNVVETFFLLHTMQSFSAAELTYLLFSRIDYCNALLTGVSKHVLNKLQ